MCATLVPRSHWRRGSAFWRKSAVDAVLSDTWMTHSASSLDQALAAYTRDSAWVEFMEDRKGQLTPGYLADIVILSGDIVKTAPEAVRELRPVMTICDGVVAYRTGA